MKTIHNAIITIISIPGIIMLLVLALIAGAIFLIYYGLTYIYFYRKRKRQEKERMWETLKK